MRLIDADALKDYFFRPYSHEESYSNIDMERIINEQPTIEPERKKGKWLIDHLVSTSGGAYQVLRCSECEHGEPMLMKKNFCPNCGADMRGESKKC